MKTIILSILILTIAKAYSDELHARIILISSPQQIDIPDNLREIAKTKNLQATTAPSINVTALKTTKVELIDNSRQLKGFERENIGLTYSVSGKNNKGVISYNLKLTLRNYTKAQKNDLNEPVAIESITYLISGKVKKGEKVWKSLGEIHFNKDSNKIKGIERFLFIRGGTCKLLIIFDDPIESKQKKENKSQ